MTKEEFEFQLEEAERTVKETGKKFFTFLPSVMLLLVAVSLTSIAAIFRFDFNLSDVILADLIIYAALRIIVMVLTKYVGADMRYQREVVEKDVTDAQEGFLKLSKKVDHGKFEKWIRIENRVAKIEAYKTKISKKIEKEESKLRILGLSYSRKPKSKTQKKMDSIKEKIEDLRRRISDSYISENISHIKVKYLQMKTTDFLSPKEFSVKIERYGMSEHEENIKSIVKGIPSALLFVVLSAMLSFDVVRGNFNAMSALFDLATILFYFLQGWSVVGRRTVALLISVYEGRKSVLSRFLDENESKEIPEKSPNFSKKEVFEKNERNEENKENA